MEYFKYVIFDSDHFLIFPEVVSHNEVFYISEQNLPVSAGFCSIERDENGYTINTWGESISLGLKSRSEDSVIIETTMNI